MKQNRKWLLFWVLVAFGFLGGYLAPPLFAFLATTLFAAVLGTEAGPMPSIPWWLLVLTGLVGALWVARQLDPRPGGTGRPSLVEPVCSRCGADMVRRRRKADGSPFYGCSAFPRCRFTRSV